MRIGKAFRRSVAGVLAAAAVSVALVGTTAAPAAASSVVGVGAVKLCTGPNYEAYAYFPDRGKMTSTIVRRNSCWRLYLGGFGGVDSSETIEFRGINPSDPNRFRRQYVANINLRYAGIGVTLAGTYGSPHVSVW